MKGQRAKKPALQWQDGRVGPPSGQRGQVFWWSPKDHFYLTYEVGQECVTAWGAMPHDHRAIFEQHGYGPAGP